MIFKNIVYLVNTRGSQKFCNILIHSYLWHEYYVTEVVQAVEGAHLLDSNT